MKVQPAKSFDNPFLKEANLSAVRLQAGGNAFKVNKPAPFEIPAKPDCKGKGQHVLLTNRK